MEAENNFFRLAYKNNEDERLNWEKDVALQFQGVYESKIFHLLNAHFEDTELKNSNSLILESIIKKYIKNEKNEDIKTHVGKCWAANWDSLNLNNAEVFTNPCYDGSYLIKITTNLQISLRRISDLFAVILYLHIAESGENTGFSVKLAAQLSLLLLMDISNDTDNYIIQGLPLVNDTFKSSYETAFKTAYLSGLTFILFHEIGHTIELNDDMALIYDLTPSYKHVDKIEKQFLSEWNSDVIGLVSTKKIFCNIEETKWMTACGILLVFVTLAITNPNVSKDTDHPSLSKRFKKAKLEIYTWFDDIEKKLIEYHINTICTLLQNENHWQEINWWK